MIFRFLYNILVIPILKMFSLVLYSFSQKYRAREKQSELDLKTLSNNPSKDKFRIWFHSSSMGEFEQAKPVIEHIKKMNSDIEIVVSFYSPSGYNNLKNYPYIEEVYYMPFDSIRKAKAFISGIKLSLAVFVRYDVWLNHLFELNNNNIPIILICGTIPGKKKRLYGGIYNLVFKNLFKYFTMIHTIGDDHSHYFSSLGISSEIVTGTDTRFDRIIKIVDESKSTPLLPENYFEVDDFVVVAGSTWAFDDELIIGTMININSDKLKLIIVPHEPNQKVVQKLLQSIKDSTTLTEIINSDSIINGKHIIVDSIGFLLRLYSYADFAYVGGGFGIGVHSVTEPAGYAIPIAVGPNYKNSPDAVNLEKAGALKSVNNVDLLSIYLTSIMNDSNYSYQLGKISGDYILSGKGESIKVAEMIVSNINDKKTLL